MRSRKAMTVAPGPTRALIYCRVSSAGQEDNASLPSQAAACRRFAAKQGWAVAMEEREVHSGADLHGRPGLRRAREAVRAGRVDVVLCYALDRLSRKQAHLAIVADECDQAGVQLAFVTEAFEHSAVGEFIRSAKAFAAEVEREKIIERTQRGIRARVESGKPVPGNKPMYGYRWRDEAKSGLDVDPATAPVVQRIFRDAVAGMTLKGIATRLTADRTPTPTGRRPTWSRATLAVILNERTYTGEARALRYRRESTKGGVSHRVRRPEDEHVVLPAGVFPALIDQGTFEAVQLRLRQNRERASRNNRDPEAALLRCGLARCGYCGARLAALNRDGRVLYRCTADWQAVRCPAFSISARELDAAVWRRVEGILTDPETVAREVGRHRQDDPSATDLEALDRRLATIGQQQQRTARAIAALDDDVTAAPLLAELRSLAEQKARLGDERVVLDAQRSAWEADQARLASLETWCRRVATNLPNLAYAQKRDILDALAVDVRVYRADHAPRYVITAAPPLEGSVASPPPLQPSIASSTAR